MHCEEKIESHKWLCSSCVGQIEFVEAVDGNKSSTLQSLGSARAFQRASKGHLAEEVAKTMAAYMIIQFQRLKWPLPDYILPSPRDPVNLLLAKHLSTFLEIPMIQALKQPGFFSPPGYKWKGTSYLSDQNLLIVDILMPNLDDFAILKEAAIKEGFYLSFM